MDMYLRMRRAVIATVCACSAVAGVGMAAGPGSALALPVVNCAAITGSGSSLQAEQQTLWTSLVGTVGFLLKINKLTEECSPGNPAISYTATSSGKGLAEFGAGTSVLEPKEAGNAALKLDAYIGTDDPPTKAQLGEMKVAAGTAAWTTAVVAAPIAMIVHLPSGCEVTTTEVPIPNKVLNEAWLGKFANWKTFLTAIETANGLKFKEATAKVSCEGSPVLLEVRSDNSGTSYAFKQYLCQFEIASWQVPAKGCEQDGEFINDSKKWPAAVSETHKAGILNEKGKGEVEAVEEEPGSLGYANLADAVKGKFTSFLKKPVGASIFWAQVENATAAREPEGATAGTGNCTATYTFPTGVEAEAKKGEWEKVHYGNPAATTGYQICTFTYDVGWENYLVTNLEKDYGGTLKAAEETGNTAQGYFEYMVRSTEGQAATAIAPDYNALPANVDKVAVEDAEKLKG